MEVPVVSLGASFADFLWNELKSTELRSDCFNLLDVDIAPFEEPSPESFPASVGPEEEE